MADVGSDGERGRELGSKHRAKLRRARTCRFRARFCLTLHLHLSCRRVQAGRGAWSGINPSEPRGKIFEVALDRLADAFREICAAI